LDEASQKLLVNLMRGHLKGGGMIIAATHVDLGLKPDKILALGANP
jgi:heme exporter protein A